MVEVTGETFDTLTEAKAALAEELFTQLLNCASGTANAAGAIKKCDNCPNLTNHWTHECQRSRKPDKTKKPGGRERDMSKVKCNQCKEMGHFASQCKAPAPINKVTTPYSVSDSITAGHTHTAHFTVQPSLTLRPHHLRQRTARLSTRRSLPTTTLCQA
eukprot:3935736-Rhodomonas_salina.1